MFFYQHILPKEFYNMSTKDTLVKKYQKHEKDFGSAPVQIALLTRRINIINNHLAAHHKGTSARKEMLQKVASDPAMKGQVFAKDPNQKIAKDHPSKRSLLKLVARRGRLQKYYKSKDLEGYNNLIQSLGLRK